jgi:hypothetical protein
MNARVIDVQIDARGSIAMFRPLSLRANRWFAAHVHSESWQWLGGALCVEHRYSHDLIRAIKCARFKVQL